MNHTKPSNDPDQRAALFNIITDSWYNLLAVYDEMDLSVGGDYRKIAIDASTESGNSEDKIESLEYGMDIIYNSAEVGCFHGKAGMRGFDLSDLEKFADRASRIRKEHKSSKLIPYGVAATSKSNNIWMNAVAAEIISRTGLEEFYFEYVKSERLFEKSVVSVKDIALNGFELTLINIPIIVDNEIVCQFVILSETSWKYREENAYNTVVIKEIHHRVKNNLQTIASLLRLQLRRSKSKVVKKALQESINKISSIALIHEELSKGGIEKINIKSTTASIMEMILGTLVPLDKDIKGELEGSDVYADANLTSMLSLCLTELIQNSVEHAFQFRKSGTIRIKVEETNGYVTVVVEDDGVGFTRKKDKNSLGLEIIEMITRESLKGEFTIEGHLYGCKSTVRFPLQTLSGRTL